MKGTIYAKSSAWNNLYTPWLSIVINLLIFCFRYDHLSNVLTKILNERPEDVCDIFEDLSRDAKKSKFTSQVDTVLDKLDTSTEVALAQIQRKLFAVSNGPLIYCF